MEKLRAMAEQRRKEKKEGKKRKTNRYGIVLWSKSTKETVENFEIQRIVLWYDFGIIVVVQFETSFSIWDVSKSALDYFRLFSLNTPWIKGYLTKARRQAKVNLLEYCFSFCIVYWRSSQPETGSATGSKTPKSGKKKGQGRRRQDDSSSDDDDGLDRFLSNQRKQDAEEENQSKKSSPRVKPKVKKRRVRKPMAQSDDRYGI